MLASVVAVTVEASLVVVEAAVVVTDVLDSLVVVSLGAAITTKLLIYSTLSKTRSRCLVAINDAFVNS